MRELVTGRAERLQIVRRIVGWSFVPVVDMQFPIGCAAILAGQLPVFASTQMVGGRGIATLLSRVRAKKRAEPALRKRSEIF
jgi:hypothetical protein